MTRIKSLQVAVGLLCLFTVFSIKADESYQFLLGVAEDFTHHEGGGEMVSIAGYGTAYIQPVLLDGSIPYAEAGFWQRISSLSASVWDHKRRDFNQVRGAALYLREKLSGKTANLRLALPSLPVWARYTYRYWDPSKTTYRYGGELVTVKSNSAIRREYQLGMYLGELTSLSFSYTKSRRIESYEAYVDFLSPTADGSFWGAEASYGLVDMNIENPNDVQSLHSGSVYRKINEFYLQAKYYPSAKLKLDINYFLQNFDAYNALQKHYIGIGVHYFVSTDISVGIDYDYITQDEELFPFWADQHRVAGNISYLF